ncbi:MAG TPA: hypothetical protein VLV78_21420 [Thermoanaerobaculia bacterium]|nr:hypothetical protein [Thermoanaerobaculia bacterium]
MTDPCSHSDSEHHVVNVCEEVIHYPSEDYPCVCTGLSAGDKKSACERCGHPASKHQNVRICRPANGEFCVCRTIIG